MPVDAFANVEETLHGRQSSNTETNTNHNKEKHFDPYICSITKHPVVNLLMPYTVKFKPNLIQV